MIANIIDGRKRPYRFLKINAIVEAAWHDNSCKDSDQVLVLPPGAVDDGPDYEEKEHISLSAALVWANSFVNQVTLYLYDEDGGIYEHVEPQSLTTEE